MSITIELLNNESPVEKIGKSLTAGGSYTCLLKENVSILDPVIILQTSDSIYNYNYMYIADFGRYYFIKDIRSLNNNRWEISAHVDVLQTYSDKILDNSAILEGTENVGKNKYLKDDVFVVNCKHKTDIMNFPSGLLDNGQFILITAGG